MVLIPFLLRAQARVPLEIRTALVLQVERIVVWVVYKVVRWFLVLGFGFKIILDQPSQGLVFHTKVKRGGLEEQVVPTLLIFLLAQVQQLLALVALALGLMFPV